MLRLLKFIFTGDWHLHEWEIEKERDMVMRNSLGKEKSYIEYVQKCKHCGELKIFNTL